MIGATLALAGVHLLRIAQLAPDLITSNLTSPNLVAPSLVASGVAAPSVVAPRVAAPGLVVPGMTPPNLDVPGLAEWGLVAPTLEALGAVVLGLLLGALAVTRRRLRRTRALLEATLAASSQGIILADRAADRILLNRRAQQVLDLPLSLLRGQPSLTAWRRWQATTRGLPPAVAPLLDPDQPLPSACVFHVEGSIYALHAERQGDALTVGTLTDLTPLRTAEHALADAQQAAATAEKRRAEFLAIMSHEMRTPLNGILGMTGLMLDMQPAPEERNYLELIRASGDQLLELITDLLDFCRLDAGRLELEIAVFDLPQKIAAAVALLKTPADAKGLTLTCDLADDLPRWVSGDPGRLRQVLLHLIGNAVKF
ncbi:MAG: hypothetical protein J0H35_08025, partial [Rhodospirillales bacterium]|nr:hypothetical protein [Rhodospirillales bacterium]